MTGESKVVPRCLAWEIATDVVMARGVAITEIGNTGTTQVTG